jgi:hypothetical protein
MKCLEFSFPKNKGHQYAKTPEKKPKMHSMAEGISNRKI